jgi:hypothetical protein
VHRPGWMPSPRAWPCSASSPGACQRARALPKSCVPPRRPANANPSLSVLGVPSPLPPWPSGAATPEHRHRTSRARRRETTTPGRQCAGAHARDDEVWRVGPRATCEGGGACAGVRRCWLCACVGRGLADAGKRRSARGCEELRGLRDSQSCVASLAWGSHLGLWS